MSGCDLCSHGDALRVVMEIRFFVCYYYSKNRWVLGVSMEKLCFFREQTLDLCNRNKCHCVRPSVDTRI